MQHYLTTILGPEIQAISAAWLEAGSHAPTTTRLASLALAKGQIALALELADRRCRLPTLANTIDYVLRAEALHRTNNQIAARVDIAHALEIDPDDIFANRKQLAWGDDDARDAAARLILELDREPALLMAALAVLKRRGVTAVARASMIDGTIRGWAAWCATPSPDGKPDPEASQTVLVEHGDAINRVRLAPDPRHKLAAAMGAANSFAVASRIGHGQWIAFRSGAGPLQLSPQFTSFAHPTKPNPPSGAGKPRLVAASPADPDVTVIIPIHGDLGATRACLDSLLASIAGERLRIRILAIDDASPEDGMADYLAGLPIDLIRNTRNLGFVGSVNAALAVARGGDVVLLNADTVLPAGAIGRLHAAARSATDIGTVTPLSNNGELTSVPIPFRDNPLPDAAMIARIDAAASQAPALIDLPTGIGFCLYVTRPCLDAVGGLSSIYERGYGEDVHLCLAAREAGFRSVCATGLFVGHAGTRSFGREKRRLVMRNSARVAGNFPEHEHEVAAFVTADPLRATRMALGRRLIDGFAGRLVVAARGSSASAQARLATLAQEGRPALLATHDRGQAVLRHFDGDGALAAQAVFELPAERAALAACTATFDCDRIEVFSPEALAAMGLDDMPAETVVHVCDAGAFAYRQDSNLASPAPDGAAAWNRAIGKAASIVAPDDSARAFATRRWKPKPVTLASPQRKRRKLSPALFDTAGRLGIVLLNETSTCRRLIRALAAHLPRQTLGAPAIVVVGATADDLGLLRGGNVVITGNVAAEEIGDMIPRYRLTHMFALSSAAHFGSPAAMTLVDLDLPLAQFAWASPAKAAGGDLWLDPDHDDGAVATRLSEWLAGPRTSP